MDSIQDYQSAVQLLLPELWVLGAILIATLWNLFFPRAREWTPIWSLTGLFLAGLQLWQQLPIASTRLFGGLFTVDKMTVSVGLLICIVGAIVVFLTMGYEQHFGENRGEFYALLLTAVLSVMLLAGTTDLIMLFVGLETLTLCTVLMSGFNKRDRRSNEASLKFLLSTAAVTATLLYGLSFVYGLTSSTNYYIIHEQLAPLLTMPTLLVVFIMVLLLSAIGFKLSLVPFHMWTPDVFEGAPTPVTAFLSIGSKIGGVVVAVRLLSFVFAGAAADWGFIVGALAIISMIMGNLIALAQNSFKRMLGYSAIAHIGYMLIGLVANNTEGLGALGFYLIVYGLMNLGAFAGAILFSHETGSDNINDYAGLIKKRPWLAVGMSICLLNLAGLPIPPAGFFAKVFIFWAGIQTYTLIGWTMVAIALITSVPAIYYYVRVIIKMVVREPSEVVENLPQERSLGAAGQSWPAFALTLCVAGLLAGSITVDPFMNASKDAVAPVTAPPAIGIDPSAGVN